MNMIINKKNYSFYFVMALFLIAFIVILIQARNIYLWDEAVFLSSAENLGKSNPYYTEIDYRPPLIILLISFGSLFMNLEMAAHIIIALFFAFGVVGIFLLTKEIYNEKAGIIASLLFISAPFIFHWASKIMNDIPAITLSIFLFYFLFKWKNENRILFILLSGLFCGLSILMRFTSFMFIPLVILFFLIFTKKQDYKHFILFLISAFVVVLPYVLWVQLTQGSFIALVLKAQKIAAESIPAVSNPLYYFNATFMILALASLFGLLLFILSKIEQKKITKVEIFLLIWFFSFLVYFSLMAHKEVRYLLPAMAPVFVLSAIGYSKIKKQFIKIIVIIAILLLFFSYLNFNYFSGKNDFKEELMLQRSKALISVAEYINKNMPQDYIIYSHSLYPIIAYYSKKPTKATWPWDETFYDQFPKNMLDSGYYIHIEGVDKEPSKEWLDQNSAFEKIREFPGQVNIIVYEYIKES